MYVDQTFVHGSPERVTEVVINPVILPTSTMAAVPLNNQQLTVDLIALKGTLQTMEAMINTTVQRMNESSQESKNLGAALDS